MVLRVLAGQGRHRVRAVLLAESRAGKLAGLFPNAPVYVASQAVLDAIAGFTLHRGILALGERAPEPPVAELLASLGPRALVLALHGIANHDNMGGLFRNAAAFGVDVVLLDPTCCDPLYRKALRVSVGGVLKVPFTRSDDLIGDLAGFEPVALSPNGVETLKDLKRPDLAALLLGAEGPGLPDTVLARCRTVRIPMSGGFDSLNVATTSGIALHHLVS